MAAANSGSDGAYYHVRQGDNLTLIALMFGFANHLPIYNHPKNADFRAQRPDPDILYPGDVIFIPKQVRQESCATDQLWSFVLNVPTKMLRITIQDAEGNAVSGAPYELTVEGTSAIMGRVQSSPASKFHGQTDGDGLIKQLVPINARRAKLKVGSFVRNIAIGDLNPPEKTADHGISGIQGRLANLGFDPGPVDGKQGPRTTAAIRAFQAKNPPLKVDGICGPLTLAKLLQAHQS